MERLSKLLKELAEDLASSRGFETVTVVPAYSGRPAPAAVSEPVVVVEQGAVTVKGSALGDFLTGGKGKRMNLSVRFTFFVPFSQGTEKAASLFVALCRALLFREKYGFISMTAGAPKVNAAKNALELTATGVLETELYREGGEA